MNDKFDYPFLVEKIDDSQNAYMYPNSGNIVVSNEKPAPILREDYSFLYKADVKKFKRLSFRLTGNCNMECPYCFTNFHKLENKLQSVQYIRAIDDFVEQLQEEDDAGIIITGGEATLYKEDILKIMEYSTERCRQKDKKIKFLLYTNFMLITSDFLQKLSNYNINIAISIDGIQEKHDLNRKNPTNKSSYKQILHNLLIAKEYPSVKLEARSVIQENEADLLQIIDNNIGLGFNRMHLMPVYGFQNKQYAGDLLIWKRALEVYEKIIINGYHIEIEPFYSIYRRIRYPHTFLTSFFPCNAGRENICLGDDGYYYICNHFVGDNVMQLGSYEGGIPNSEIIKEKMAHLSNDALCQNCDFLRLCGGACYHKVAINKAPKTYSDCKNWMEIIKMTIVSYIRIYNVSPDMLAMLCDTDKEYNKIDKKMVIENIKLQLDDIEKRGVE